MRVAFRTTNEITKLENTLRVERIDLNKDELATATPELEFFSVHCGHSKS